MQQYKKMFTTQRPSFCCSFHFLLRMRWGGGSKYGDSLPWGSEPFLSSFGSLNMKIFFFHSLESIKNTHSFFLMGSLTMTFPTPIWVHLRQFFSFTERKSQRGHTLLWLPGVQLYKLLYISFAETLAAEFSFYRSLRNEKILKNPLSLTSLLYILVVIATSLCTLLYLFSGGPVPLSKFVFPWP